MIFIFLFFEKMFCTGFLEISIIKFLLWDRHKFEGYDCRPRIFDREM